ncbi:MAG: hypothetical protein ABEK59_01015 [Halobacteria archaeon]
MVKSTRPDDTAQTATVGVVLILAITLTSMGVIISFSGPTMKKLTDDATNRDVQNHLSRLDTKASRVSSGTPTREQMRMNLHGGKLNVTKGAGNMKILHDPAGQPEYTIYNNSMGKVRYSNGDDVLAYQGGGVWRKYDNHSTVISEPDLEYRKRTLSFPLIFVDNNRSFGGEYADIEVEHTDSQQVHANLSKGFTNPLKNGSVEFSIESEYYQGWKDYFASSTPASVTDVDDSQDRVNVSFNVPVEIDFEYAVATDTNTLTTSGNAKIDGRTLKGGNFPSPNQTIQDEVDEWDDGACSASSDCVNLSTAASDGVVGDDHDASVYYQGSDFRLDQDTDVNLSHGNASVVVDGDFDVENRDWKITSDNGSMTYYVNGSFEGKGNGYVGKGPFDGGPTDRNVFLIAGGFLPGSSGQGNGNGNGNGNNGNSGGGTIDLEGHFYASNADVDLTGTPHLYGSLIANSVDFSGTVDVEGTSDASIKLGTGNILTYLHLEKNEMEFR